MSNSFGQAGDRVARRLRNCSCASSAAMVLRISRLSASVKSSTWGRDNVVDDDFSRWEEAFFATLRQV
jgi:hypothetical protein